MTLEDTLAAMIDVMPNGSSVTLPVEWIRTELARDGRGQDPGSLADLTATEFADEIGRAPSTVRTWLSAGEVERAYKLQGREWRIPRSAARQYLDSMANKQVRSRTKRGSRPQARLSMWRHHVGNKAPEGSMVRGENEDLPVDGTS